MFFCLEFHDRRRVEYMVAMVSALEMEMDLWHSEKQKWSHFSHHQQQLICLHDAIYLLKVLIPCYCRQMRDPKGIVKELCPMHEIKWDELTENKIGTRPEMVTISMSKGCEICLLLFLLFRYLETSFQNSGLILKALFSFPVLLSSFHFFFHLHFLLPSSSSPGACVPKPIILITPCSFCCNNVLSWLYIVKA